MTQPHELPQETIFTHRISADALKSQLGTVDALGLMTERLEGILYLLSFHFQGEQRACDSIILGVIEAAIHECKDINATINAHYDLTKARMVCA